MPVDIKVLAFARAARGWACLRGSQGDIPRRKITSAKPRSGDAGAKVFDKIAAAICLSGKLIARETAPCPVD
jgi:hypothetical protein